MMKRMRQLALVLIVLGALPLQVRAQDTSTERDRQAERDRPGLPRGPMGPRGFGWRFRLSPEEWADASKFMKEHSPKRWESYEKLPPEQQDRLQRAISMRWRTLQQLKDSEPEIYKMRVKRMELEDEIFTLTRDLRHADGKKETEIGRAHV